MRSDIQLGCSPAQFSARHLAYGPCGVLTSGSSRLSFRGFVAGSDVITAVSSSADRSIATVLGRWPVAAGSASVLVDLLGGAVA